MTTIKSVIRSTTSLKSRQPDVVAYLTGVDNGLRGPIPTPPPVIAADGTYEIGGVLYGPNYGPRGPMQVIIGVWNQGDVGYCFENNNVAEDLHAKWASRGINLMKAGHPDAVLQGRATQYLTAAKNAGLMLEASPTWYQFLQPIGDPASKDLRDLAMNDPYWRVNWITYHAVDEIDLQAYPLSDHVTFMDGWPLAGVSKPISANFTRRVAVPSSTYGSSTINFYEAFNLPQILQLALDSYEWHLTAPSANTITPPELRSSGDTFISTWHSNGVYTDTDRGSQTSIGSRFTASVTGLAVHRMRNGPVAPGFSDSGNLPVQYPPFQFNTPPNSIQGLIIAPQPMAYAPGDKPTGHHIATGRVELSSPQYLGSGQWQPGRYLRNESWSGFVHGSSAIYLFPQTVGTPQATGYIDAVANTVVITSEPVRPFLFGGALRIITPGDFTLRGWVRRDSPQLSGTPGGAGTYALDVTKGAPVATGSVGSPVTLEFSTEGYAWSDDSNPENLAELAAVIDNLERMQAHPTGGNLLIDTAQGGRRAFTVMRCPDIDGDVGLYREDMTLAPIQAGYTLGGTPILDDAGGGPMWDFGWPMGFEGFRVVGDDGATYLYVRSMSNSNRPTFFPGYAALGLPARVFGPFELAGFRRVGVGSAVEMTGSSGVIKAGVDDGAATWFYIESGTVSANEGNSGTTAYTFTIRRGGDLSGTDTVTATVSGTGITPAAASDFSGGTFPTQVLTFNPTETTKTFTANVIGDTTSEFNETALVTLSAPSAGQLVGSNKSKALFSIVNDDAVKISAFVWLVDTDETSALALPGSPVGATYLKASETTYQTRSGVKVRALTPLFGNNSSGFAGTPFVSSANAFSSVEFGIAPGNWEIGIIVSGNPAGNTLTVIDDPDGTPSTEVSLALAARAGASLSDTDGTEYTNASTAVADAVNNLTFVPVTVTDAGGGEGRVRVYCSGSAANLCAICIRQV